MSLELEKAALLTRHFYLWERRGRGWETYPIRVGLEPPFAPFDDHPVFQLVDDGRRHSWLSRIFDRGRSSASCTSSQLSDGGIEHEEPLPAPWARDGELCEFAIILPEKQPVPRSVAASWLRALSTTAGGFSFELIGQAGRVALHMTCEERDLPHAISQTRAYFPMAGLMSPPEGCSLAARWGGAEGFASVLEFGLAKEFMLNLSASDGWNPDPLTPLIGTLAESGPDELVVVQVLFEAVRQPWEDSVIRAVTTSDGKPFFADAPELTRQAERKVASGLFSVVLRLAAVGESSSRPWQLLRSLASGLAQFGSEEGNELVPLGDEGVESHDH